MSEAPNQSLPPSAPPPGSDPGGAGAGSAGTTGPAGAAWEPPPLTALAWRYGLVRPRKGRVFAGVCGALGRSTNTDPVLWRVVLAVLTVFAFIGAVAYLALWLCLPAEGDTASPVEALIGRGRSGTSTILTILGGIIVIFSLAGYLSEPLRATPLLAVILLAGALLLLLRDQRGRPRPPATGPGAPQWSAAPAGGEPTGGPGPSTAASTSEVGSVPPSPPPPSGPFAPHGPFAPAGTASPSSSYEPPMPPPYAPPAYVPPVPPPPPPIPPMPPRPPRPPRPRSRLGLLTLSVVLVVVGILALVDLAAYQNVPLGAYFAAALAVVGLGLLLGTWIGRSRGLIAWGIVLTLLLGGSYGVDEIHNWRDTGSHRWVPANISQIQSSYRYDIGDATLDLSGVDFSEADGPVDIEASLAIGSLVIILPQEVDAVVEADVDVGYLQVFDHESGGLDPDLATITDFGPDGPGGGQVRIVASVDLGNLEVQR